MAAPTQEQVVEALKTIYDPEIPVDIYNLGLVYEVLVKDPDVEITMTLTSEACPSAKQIPNDVKKKVEAMEGVTECRVAVVFQPKWSAERISPEGRTALGLDDS